MRERTVRWAVVLVCALSVGANAACGNAMCDGGGDADGDGHKAIACGGDDCNDHDPLSHPGLPEVCDVAARDEDCNPMTVGPDHDGDGLASTSCCNRTAGDGGAIVCGTDCDDSSAVAHPGGTEVCDGIDDDCNGVLDDGFPTMPYYQDCDGDGHGTTSASPVQACTTPHAPSGFCAPSPSVGWSTTNDDCNDLVASAHPGATELCNGVDDDCDGTIDGASASSSCPTGANVASATCSMATCTLTCTAGYLDCTSADGCETDGTTTTDCGACGHTCTWHTCNFDTCDDAVWLGGGFGHTCAALASGAVYCWGGGTTGALGTGSLASATMPVQAMGITDAHSIAVGSFFTCAQHASGTVSCWGIDAHGQLGDGGGAPNRPSPVDVMGITDARWIAAGNEFACAVHADGTVSCWGRNDAGQLGDGTMTESSVPVAVAMIPDAVEVAAGSDFACALKTAGTAECWGDNAAGQFGHGNTMPYTTPQYVSGVSDATEIVAGTTHACVLHATGTVSCWGSNAYGQLGDNTSRDSSVPVDVHALTGVRSIVAGGDHTCALQSTGRVVCWGRNDHGQLGLGTADSPVPIEVHNLHDAVLIGVGQKHSCARRTAGGVVCWGQNMSGELGDGTMTDASDFVTVLSP